MTQHLEPSEEQPLHTVVYVFEEPGITYNPDDATDDRVWMQGPFECPVCNLGIDADGTEEEPIVEACYPDTLTIVPCPVCGHRLEAPHLAELEQDENGVWYERDDLAPPDEAEDDDDAECAFA